MSYRETKEKAAAKSRKIKYILLAVLLFLLSGLCIFAAFFPASAWKYYVKLPTIGKRAEGELKIHFLDVGQGDCTILEFPDGRTMLIDGGDGEKENTTSILRYVNALKIKKLDFLLLTHADTDHCGGLSEILKVKGAVTVYAPVVKDIHINSAFAAFSAALAKSDCETVISQRYLQVVSRDDSYPYTLTFLSPYAAGNPGGSPYDKVNGGKYTDDDVNDTSAVVWLDYKGTDALFCGDATSKVETLLAEDDRSGFFSVCGVDLSSTEILKVAHHGSDSSTQKAFAQMLGVRTAVISCGKNNLYGHPAASVCDTLEKVGAEIYRTDRMGNIVVTISPDGSYRVDAQY